MNEIERRNAFKERKGKKSKACHGKQYLRSRKYGPCLPKIKEKKEREKRNEKQRMSDKNEKYVNT